MSKASRQASLVLAKAMTWFLENDEAFGLGCDAVGIPAEDRPTAKDAAEALRADLEARAKLPDVGTKLACPGCHRILLSPIAITPDVEIDCGPDHVIRSDAETWVIREDGSAEVTISAK